MTERGRVVVVGGGVFGLSGALALRRRGFSVDLVEAGPIPHPRASSTDINKMVRMDYGADRFYCQWMLEGLRRWQAWNQLFERPLFHEHGFLVLKTAPLTDQSFEGASLSMVRSLGAPAERLSAEDLAERFPALAAPPLVDGYFNPLAGWAESGAVVAAMAEWAEREGVALHPNQPCRRLVERNGRVYGVELSESQTLAAEWTVLALGAWTAQLIPELADRLRPIGQTVLHFQPPDPSPYRYPRFAPWCIDIAETGWYGFPATTDGRVKVANHGPGQLVEPDGHHDVDGAVEGACRAFLARVIPGLADSPVVEQRLCLYCDSFDGEFLIDRHPLRAGLVVATGGSGHGFKFAPLLGDVIADVIEGRLTEARRRFAWRALGRSRSEAARRHSPRT